MKGAVHMQIATIGLDIAKNVFQVHGIDATEKVIVRKQLRRGQVMAFFEALTPCLIGVEACATSPHWARELTKLGHEVRLMPAKDVKAYVRRNKNDAADAEAICEPVRRPTMRFVRIKSAEQQGQLMLHRARDLLMRQRIQVINALRAHLAEFGITAAQGREGIKELLATVAQDDGSRLPVDAHVSLTVLATQLQTVQTMIVSLEKRIVTQHRSNEASKRLETIPGIGRHHPATSMTGLSGNQIGNPGCRTARENISIPKLSICSLFQFNGEPLPVRLARFARHAPACRSSPR